MRPGAFLRKQEDATAKGWRLIFAGHAGVSTRAAVIYKLQKSKMTRIITAD